MSVDPLHPSDPQETRQYQKAARDSRVVMYRQYREGELPDIQIKYSELIRPLQALAQVCVCVGGHVDVFVCVYLRVRVTDHSGKTVHTYSTCLKLMRGGVHCKRLAII